MGFQRGGGGGRGRGGGGSNFRGRGGGGRGRGRGGNFHGGGGGRNFNSPALSTKSDSSSFSRGGRGGGRGGGGRHSFGGRVSKPFQQRGGFGKFPGGGSGGKGNVSWKSPPELASPKGKNYHDEEDSENDDEEAGASSGEGEEFVTPNQSFGKQAQPKSQANGGSLKLIGSAGGNPQMVGKSPTKGILKQTPQSNASSGANSHLSSTGKKKNVTLNAGQSPALPSRTPSTPHPSSGKKAMLGAKEAIGGAGGKKKPSLFDDDEDDDDDEDEEDDLDSDDIDDEEESDEEMDEEAGGYEDDEELEDEESGDEAGSVQPVSKKNAGSVQLKANKPIATSTPQTKAATNSKQSSASVTSQVKAKAKGMKEVQSDSDQGDGEEDDDDEELSDEEGLSDEEMDDEDEEEEDDDEDGTLLKSIQAEKAKAKHESLAKGKSPNASIAKQLTAKKGEDAGKAAPKAKLGNAATGKKPLMGEDSDEDEDGDEELDEDDEEEDQEAEEKPQPASAVTSKQSLPTQQPGQKRKAAESVAASSGQPSAKHQLVDQTTVVAEEERRRENRNRQSLFVKGVSKKADASDLKKLHAEIAAVRLAGKHAWLVFHTEAACNKAYGELKESKLAGKPLVIDFCGDKSKTNKDHLQRENEKRDRSINALEILVSGLSKSVNKEQLKSVFPGAKNINIPSRAQNQNCIAFITFEDANAARQAFIKGDNLKIGGTPVDVFYSRVNTQTDKIKPKQKAPVEPKLKESKPTEKVQKGQKASQPQPAAAKSQDAQQKQKSKQKPEKPEKKAAQPATNKQQQQQKAKPQQQKKKAAAAAVEAMGEQESSSDSDAE